MLHTLLFSSLAILMGYQSVLFAIFAKTFAISEGLLPKDPRVDRFFNVIYLERGLAIGAAAFSIGLILLAAAVLQWKSVAFRPSRLLRHHALGHSGRDADGVGLSNDTLKFLREHSGDETSHVSQASTALKSESDALCSFASKIDPRSFASLRMTFQASAPRHHLEKKTSEIFGFRNCRQEPDDPVPARIGANGARSDARPQARRRLFPKVLHHSRDASRRTSPANHLSIRA